MKKASSGINFDINLEMTPIWECCALFIRSSSTYICQDPRIARGRITPKFKNKVHFSLVSLSVYPRSRRGAERIRQGEGRLSRPPETALERS